MARIALLACMTVALFACSEDPEPVTPPAVDPAETPDEEPVEEEPAAETEAIEPETGAQAQMHDRYEAVEAMRRAFVRGELEGAKALARQIGPVTAELPPAATELRDTVPVQAAALAEASDLEAAARAFGTMLVACGDCHQRAEATWSFETPTVPIGDDLPEHMRRHEWAVDRMWEALLVADDERFDLGARALMEAPLTGDEPPDEETPAGVSGLAQRVHERAAAASDAASMNERAEIFGEVLATCGECHRHFDDLDRLGAD